MAYTLVTPYQWQTWGAGTGEFTKYSRLAGRRFNGGTIDGMRKSGRLTPGYPGHPKDLNGFSIICGLDPAMIGDTAAICYAVDRGSNKRYIIDAIKISRPSPADIRDLIFNWTSLYGPSEWIVERNAFQSFLTQEELYTSSNWPNLVMMQEQ